MANYLGSEFTLQPAYLCHRMFYALPRGHTIDMRQAADIGNLAMLERLIGIGQHMKVSMEDRVCRRAEDCTSVQTHCGECSCGTPVARVAVERYEARFERLCAAIRFAERCEMNCPPPALSCTAGFCVAE